MPSFRPLIVDWLRLIFENNSFWTSCARWSTRVGWKEIRHHALSPLFLSLFLSLCVCNWEQRSRDSHLFACSDGNQSIGSSQPVMRCEKRSVWRQQFHIEKTIIREMKRTKKKQTVFRRWQSTGTRSLGTQNRRCQSNGSNLIDRIYWSNVKSNYVGTFTCHFQALRAHSLNAIENCVRSHQSWNSSGVCVRCACN